MRPELLLALALVTTSAVAADTASLGTLFHTAEERARLDKMRRGEPDLPASISGKPQVTGYVRRSDGRSTVWVDGVPLSVAGKAADALLKPDAVDADQSRDFKIERSDRPRVKR